MLFVGCKEDKKMNENQENQSKKETYPTLKFADFLENSPAYHPGIIYDLRYSSGRSDHDFCRPELSLLCEHDACEGIVADLSKAKDTFHFTQSLAGVELAIPQVLLIDGHNPLILLHSALSAGRDATRARPCPTP
jgi:hypothetical protein